MLLSWFGKIKNIILTPFYWLRAYPPIWRFLNRSARHRYREQAPHLSMTQERVVRELREQGISIVHAEELLSDQNILSEVYAYAQQDFPAREERTETKTYFVELLGLRPKLRSLDPFLTLALTAPVLNVVNSYFDLWTQLNSVSLSLTQITAPNSPALYSQCWHRDPEDIQTCKVFLYFHDVDETTGPLQYIKGSHGRGRWGNLLGQRPPRGRYPPEGALERIIPPEDIVTCTGKAGTLIFCDTRGFHRGGYATSHTRQMLTLGFVSPVSPWPQRFELAFDPGSVSLNEAAYFALDGRKKFLWSLKTFS